MRSLKHILLSVLVLTRVFCIAQNPPVWKDITKEQAKQFMREMKIWLDKHPDYSVDVNYYSYKSYTDVTPADKSAGYIKKEGSNMNSLNIGVRNVQNSSYFISMDTTQKIMLIANPKNNTKSFSSIDTSQIMKQVNKFKTSSNTGESALRIEYKNNPSIGSVEIFTDKNGELKKIVWYYSGSIPNLDKKDKEYSLPKVEVVFSNYKLNVNFDKREFDEKQFFTLKDKVFVPTQKYRDYKIKDTRYEKH